MTDDLTKKLDEIVRFMGDSYYPSHEYPDTYEPDNVKFRTEAVKQITKAFIDAGWVTPEDKMRVQGLINDIANMTSTAYNQPTIVYVHVDKKAMTAKNLMTGREWYDKFKKEFEANKQFRDQVNYMWSASTIEEAAKKAAGIE